MSDYLATLADRRWFAPLDRWQLDATTDRHLARVPHGPVGVADRTPAPGWTTRTSGPWTISIPPATTLPLQGWKIHLAPSVPRARAVTERAVRFCVERNLPFKHLTRLEYMWALNGKYAPRQASGKSVVIYPLDGNDPSGLVRELVAEFGDEQGPAVLGSHRVRHTIVHLRYGGFRRILGRTHTGESVPVIVDPAGRAVPDRRGVTPVDPDFVTRPAVLDEDATDDGETTASPRAAGAHGIYRITGALHFSNTGGVYRGVETASGRDVVLKEARHHTGFDAGMNPATVRLRRQFDAMRALSDTGYVPAVLEYFTQGDSDFLVYEFAPGQTLQEWSASHNPALLRTAPDAPLAPSEAARFRREVGDLAQRLRAMVTAIHDAGHLACDIHPANVIVETGDAGPRLWLVDLEGALPTADAVSDFVGAQGFFRIGARGTEIDEYAVAATELYLYAPMAPSVAYFDHGVERVIGYATATFWHDESWAASLAPALRADPALVRHHRPRGRVELLDAAAEGLARSIDPDREDALRSGPAGFEYSGRFGVSAGLPGAMWALACAGAVPAHLVERYDAWLDRHRGLFGEHHDGLLDGWAGNTVVAATLGLRDRADTLVQRMVDVADPDRAPLSLRAGVAGFVACGLWHHRHGSRTIDLHTVEKAADILVERVREQIDSSTVVPTGLLDGASGIALALGRLHRVVPKADYADTVRLLLAAEASTYLEHPSGAAHHWDGRSRLLAYLDRGNCGFVLVANELADLGDLDPAFVRRVQHGACSRIGVQPGLYLGIAGGLVANAHLARSTGFDTEYLDRCIDQIFPGVDAFCGSVSGRIAAAGAGALRAQDDFAGGTAGIVAALAVATGRSTSWLPGVF